jgi:hypothetical protein
MRTATDEPLHLVAMGVRPSRRVVFAVFGTVALLGSWVVAWSLPSPRVCVALYCGANFNPNQVSWRWLSFWNWPQLVVVVVGLIAFTILMVLAVRHPRNRPESVERRVSLPR